MPLFKRKKNNWIGLNSPEQLDSILNNKAGKSYIFKHSTRCSISTMAKARLDSIAFDDGSFYYLDLLSYRSISNSIEEKFGIEHQSPQLIVLNEGKVIGSLTHNGISGPNIQELENSI
ncbi:bacillithiol system redox-active protein YtxJ [Bacteroidia bacterium]|jgi:bacillithiol system protein YtxJ|nr:bacillithiol system redox-active protein YtxJ [Bacteroidia bacterium]